MSITRDEMDPAILAEIEAEKPPANAEQIAAEIERLRRAFAAVDKPIPMILHCPVCNLQHIDAPEHVLVWTGGSAPEPSHDEVVWENPPHRSHLCHACGCIWRPADVATEGVASIETRGKADTWPTP